MRPLKQTLLGLFSSNNTYKTFKVYIKPRILDQESSIICYNSFNRLIALYVPWFRGLGEHVITSSSFSLSEVAMSNSAVSPGGSLGCERVLGREDI